MPTVCPTGAKDKTLSKKELRNRIATAKTQADHERIAQYFDAEAAKYEADAKDHADLAQFYQQHTAMSPKYPGGQQSFHHCDALSKSLTQALKMLANSQRNTGRWPKKRQSKSSSNDGPAIRDPDCNMRVDPRPRKSKYHGRTPLFLLCQL